MDENDPQHDQYRVNFLFITWYLMEKGLNNSVTTSASPTTSTQGYASGICSIHVNEEDRCNPSDSDLFGTVTIKDFGGNVLCGGSDLIVPLNDKNPGKLNCQLPYPITITGEHVGDYVQFTYGSLSWRSTDNVQG